jgi:metal-sulfur cluster biosynthetic enzyme
VTAPEEVLAALDAVRDPELDEPVTSLGFVASCTVSADGVASVRLRLPTYFCAPNFAYLMVADAFDAVSAVEGVHEADVVLVDHFASDTINAGVAARSGFVRSFEGEAVDELDGLRADFVRKAVLAGTDRVCRPLLAAGVTTDELAALTLGQVPATPDRERLRSRRAELGLPSGDDAPLLVDATTGEAVGAEVLPMHLARTRLTRVSVEANSGVCRGLLRERYPAAVGQGQTQERP